MPEHKTPTRLAVPLLAVTMGVLGLAAAPAAAFKTSRHSAGGENTPLNLSGASSGSHAASSGGSSLTRTVVGLAIVIAVIWGLYWILRQVKAGRDPHVGSAGLANVAALQLGSGRSLHLVRAGSDYVLLAANEHGLAPIQRYTEEQARSAGLLAAPAPPPRMSFARQLLAAQLTPPTAVPGQFTPGQVVSGHVVADLSRRPDPMGGAPEGMLSRLRELTVRR